MRHEAFAVAGLVAALGAAGCRQSASGPSAFDSVLLPLARTTDAFEYRFAAGDTVDVEWQEAYHRWAVEALQIPAPRRIRYNKYRDRAHMQQVIGVGNSNAFADAGTFEIHTIWSRDNHETVHLYASAFGRPGALWNEGLAVALQVDPVAGDFVPRWSGVALDDRVRQFASDGRLLPLVDLATTSGFRRFDANVTYPEAGAFVRFVMDTCGLPGIRALFASGSVDDSAEAVGSKFKTACRQTLSSAEQAWRARLGIR